MKNLMLAMTLACALGASAAPVDAESSPRSTATAAVTAGRGQGPASTQTAAPVDAASSPRQAQAVSRPKLTEAQRAELKARREKFMAARRAEMEARMLEVVKKYVPEEEKAKALVKELQEAMRSSRRGPKGHPLPPAKRKESHE